MVISRKIIRRLVVFLPAISLIPAIAKPLGVYRPGVELAQYFQTLAFVRDGLASYTYLTPGESNGGLHIHSILSAPLLAADVHSAGRIVSVLAAITAVVLIMRLVSQILDERIGVLAGAFLWLHPLFLHLASTWNPYILGITLTIGALYSAYWYIESPTPIRFIILLAILSIAIFNHTWEASIALPIVVLFGLHRRYKAIGAVVVTVAAAIGIVFAARVFQPENVSLIQSYSVFFRPSSLFTWEWLLWDRFGAWQPWRYVIVFTIPMVIV
jgi:hypothetical protein